MSINDVMDDKPIKDDFITDTTSIPFNIDDLPTDLITVMYNLLDPVMQVMFSFTCRRYRSTYTLPIKKSDTCAESARYNYPIVLAWCRRNDCDWNENVIRATTEGGHLELLQCLLQWPCSRCWKWIPSPKSYSSVYNEIDFILNSSYHRRLLQQLLQHLLQLGCPMCKLEYINNIGQLSNYHSSNIETEQPNYYRTLGLIAAMNGRQNILEWLIEENKYHPDYATESAAALYGHLHILQWLESTGHPSNDQAIFKYAVAGGYLDVIKWLYETQYKNRNYHISDTIAGVSACSIAAAHNHLDILIWLRSIGVRWNEDTYSAAVHENGDPVMIAWLQDNGCPISDVINNHCNYRSMWTAKSLIGRIE